MLATLLLARKFKISDVLFKKPTKPEASPRHVFKPLILNLKLYKHIFFDLDHTLWDFDRNSRETLEELFEAYSLKNYGIAVFEDFRDTYHRINDQKWEQYRQGSITKEHLRATRFHDTLLQFEVNHPELAAEIDREYIARSPHKTHLFPHALEVLGYLAEKYTLHIITNGFTEVQDIKITKSGLQPFFTYKITSEAAGATKPDPVIFRHALKMAGAKRTESIMVGDNLEVDIIGARRVGLDQVYFNPDKKPHSEKVTFEIGNLGELKAIL
jgi:putative hydrolase of the HAD superfamily